MKESNLKLAQQDIDEALKAVEEMEEFIIRDDLQKNIKRKILCFNSKGQQLEDILKMKEYYKINI